MQGRAMTMQDRFHVACHVAWLACLALLAWAGTAVAAPIAYVATFDGELGTLDLDSGVYTRIGAVGST